MESGQERISENETLPGWAVIVNPNSGSGKGREDWPLIRQQIDESGLDYKQWFTGHKQHAIELVQEMIAVGYRKFISVGGDGLLNEIVNGIMTQSRVQPEEITIGMIPVGTGNDWCRTTSVPLTYREAIDVIGRGKLVLHDVGELEYLDNGEVVMRYFINMVGTGFDAAVAEKINKAKIRGGRRKSYLKELVTTLFSYQTTRMSFRFKEDNGPITEYSSPVFSVGIGIGKYNGGGMLQAPGARIDDGLFQITVIRKLSPFSVILHLPKLFNGRIEKHPRVISFVAQEIDITSWPAVGVEADGESLGTSPLVVRNSKNRIGMIVG